MAAGLSPAVRRPPRHRAFSTCHSSAFRTASLGSCGHGDDGWPVAGQRTGGRGVARGPDGVPSHNGLAGSSGVAPPGLLPGPVDGLRRPPWWRPVPLASGSTSGVRPRGRCELAAILEVADMSSWPVRSGTSRGVRGIVAAGWRLNPGPGEWATCRPTRPPREKERPHWAHRHRSTRPDLRGAGARMSRRPWWCRRRIRLLRRQVRDSETRLVLDPGPSVARHGRLRLAAPAGGPGRRRPTGGVLMLGRAAGFSLMDSTRSSAHRRRGGRRRQHGIWAWRSTRSGALRYDGWAELRGPARPGVEALGGHGELVRPAEIGPALDRPGAAAGELLTDPADVYPRSSP